MGDNMKKQITICLILMSLVFALMANVKFDSKNCVPNTILVCFKVDAINSTKGEINITHEDGLVQIGLRSFDLLSKTYQFTDLEQVVWVKDQKWVDEDGVAPMNIFRVTIKDNQKIEDARNALEKDTNILFAEFDAIMKQKYIPNDPQLSMQWHLETISAYPLWDFFYGDSTIVVGIVDSGTKWNHEDLRANIWINQAELEAGMTINWANGTVSGGNGVDNDGNGKVDDVIGWDFFSNDNNPYQSFYGNDHGSHVAGCVGAVTNNGLGVASAAQKVKLMITKHQSNTQSSTSVSNGLNGITYCADTGAHIINCSWGGYGGSASSYNNIINYAMNQGALVLAAAGNDNVDHTTTPGYPSDAINAVSVAASNQSDEKADFSDYGTPIDLISPGVSIRSTIYNQTGASTYANFDGTSMATPVAAGVAAMIKSTHPNYTVQEVRARLLATADVIEQMFGTVYEGKLGSGRVNAFSAILSDIIPNLSIVNKVIEEDQGDGDQMPNPGEVIRVKLTLENEVNWYDANNIYAVIRTNLNGVTIIDSVLNFAEIYNGFQGTSSNFFKFSTPANFNVYDIPFSLHLTANHNPSADVEYIKDIPFNVSLSLFQSGWPISLPSASTSAPIMIDLKRNNQQILVFGDQSGNVNALKADGTQLTGFPVNVGSSIPNGIAVVDLTGDNKYEIVAAAMNSIVKIIDHNGQVLATQNLTGNIRNCPVVADVTGDSQLEVIIGTQSKFVYVLNSNDLSIVSGYPVELEAAIINNLAAEDINNDGKDDIIVATGQKLHVLNGSNGQNITGWPVTLSSASVNGPTVGNFDNQLNTKEIVIAGSASSNAPVTVYSSTGTVLSNIVTPNSVKSEIAVIDLNNDNIHEICYTDYSGRLFVRDASLSPVVNFPVTINGAVESSPVVYSLNTQNEMSFIFGDNNGYLHAINTSGNEIAGFPVYCGSALKTSPAIGYFDTDNDIDLLFPNTNQMVYIDYKSQGGDAKWAMFRGNPLRTGSAFDIALSNEDQIVPVKDNELQQNYPNPFNPTTSISFNLKNNSFVKLNIYNVKGQLVKSLVNQRFAQGQHSVTWNGKDNQNKSVSSGVYFYRLDGDDFSFTKKMMLIK